MQSSSSLTLKNVWLERAERNLCKGFALSLQAGEAVRVIGENGVGKSSLLKAILGLLNTTAGDIEYRSNNVLLGREEMLSQALYIGHNSGLKPMLTVDENLHYYAPKASTSARLAALECFALADFLQTPVKALSAGQARKVALCRLVLTPKPLWLLDEPYTALDTQAIATLEKLIQQHLATAGMLLLTSHQTPVSFSPRQVVLAS